MKERLELKVEIRKKDTHIIILMFTSVSPDVVVGPAVAPAELTWDNEDDNVDVVVAAVVAVVVVVVVAVVVSVTTVTAMVGLVPGVVFPLLNVNVIIICNCIPPSSLKHYQVWISPIEASSAFLQTEKFPRQRSFTARRFRNSCLALHFSDLTVFTISAAAA